MTLATSPIDSPEMRKIRRYGIDFEVCPSTGGVVLDESGLKKLVALVKDETLHDSGAKRGRHQDMMTSIVAMTATIAAVTSMAAVAVLS